MKATNETDKSQKDALSLVNKLTIGKHKETTTFYGKPIRLDDALEETHTVVEYYEALKNGRNLPQKPHHSLDYLLRCNAITSLHYTQTNLQLRGIGFKNWALTPDQVIYTWLFAHKGQTDKPLITLGGKSICINQKEGAL